MLWVLKNGAEILILPKGWSLLCLQEQEQKSTTWTFSQVMLQVLFTSIEERMWQPLSFLVLQNKLKILASSLLEAHPYGAYKKKKEQKLVTWTFSRVHVASLVFIPFSFEKYQNDMITLILFGVAKWSQNSSSSSLTDRLERNMMSTWAFYWTTQTKYSDNQWWGPSEEAMAMWFHLVSCLYSA